MDTYFIHRCPRRYYSKLYKSGLTAEYGTNPTVITLTQGATSYEVTPVQIGGVAQTINWQGGSAPTGNANGIDPAHLQY